VERLISPEGGERKRERPGIVEKKEFKGGKSNSTCEKTLQRSWPEWGMSPRKQIKCA